MAIAEMPGDANQMQRLLAANLQKRLRRRDHFDQPAVLEHQCIAATQGCRIFEIKQEFKPARACHRHAPPVAVAEIEHDGIGRRLAPAMMFRNLDGAYHSQNFSILASLMISITVGEAR